MSLLARFRRGENFSSADFVRELGERPLDAEERCEQSGNTLLHYLCCAGDAPEAVVAALLKAYPGNAAAEDADGNVPLVGAVSNGCLPATVRVLLEAHPAGGRWTNQGHTLLHFAACNQAAPEVVQLLLQAWPEAARQRDPEGNTPLHFAAACQARPAVVKLLIEAYPEAAQLQGRMQRRPLNLAMLCKTHPEALMMIKEAFPGALYDESLVADHFNSDTLLVHMDPGDRRNVPDDAVVLVDPKGVFAKIFAKQSHLRTCIL